MNFGLDQSIYEHALNNPFSGSAVPARAALGRAAEPELVRIYASLHGGTIVRSGAPLPTDISSDRAHDGGLFVDAQLVAILEAKLALKPTIVISSAEIKTLDWCLDNKMPYVLIAGRYLGNLVGKYLGAVQITRDVRRYLGETVSYGLQFEISKMPWK